MISKRILQIGDPSLREIATEVQEVTDSLKAKAQRMSIMLHISGGYGLAANQVGLNERFFVYKLNRTIKTIINPVIVDSSTDVITMDEGCLSIKGFTFPIERPKTVTLSGVDFDGNDIHIESDGISARLFQHELQHLNGGLLVDLLSPEQLEDFNRKWNHKKKRK